MNQDIQSAALDPRHAKVTPAFILGLLHTLRSAYGWFSPATVERSPVKPWRKALKRGEQIVAPGAKCAHPFEPGSESETSYSQGQVYAVMRIKEEMERGLLRGRREWSEQKDQSEKS